MKQTLLDLFDQVTPDIDGFQEAGQEPETEETEFPYPGEEES